MEKPNGFIFTPGQFVLLDVPLPDNAYDIQPRAYSIASTPSESDLRFAMKIVPGGRASTWIDQRMDKGTKISFKGPFGIFTLDRTTKKPYLFIATGVGVAPFRSQLRWALQEQNDTRPMHLLFGVVSKKDLFWMEEWQKLKESHENFHVHLSLLEGRGENQAPVHEQIPKLICDPTNISTYICGAPDMVKEMKGLCLTKFRVPKENVHTEAYI